MWKFHLNKDKENVSWQGMRNFNLSGVTRAFDLVRLMNKAQNSIQRRANLI